MNSCFYKNSENMELIALYYIDTTLKVKVYKFNNKLDFKQLMKNMPRRERFVSFRFEQSLRKYQPPIRKMHKPDELHSHYFQFNNDEIDEKERRLLRLCQTRKKYQMTSRQKASEFSRKKQLKQESGKRQKQDLVSNFDCSQNSQIPQYEMEDKMNKQNCKHSSLNFFEKISVSTPVKQQIQRNILSEHENICKQLQEVENEQQIKKTKNIEFHIGLVEKLHSQFVEHCQKDMQALYFDESSGKTNEMSDIEEQLRQFEAMVKEFQNLNMEMEKKDEVIIKEVDDQLSESMDNTQKINKKSSKREAKMLASCEISIDNGRVKLQGNNGPCYLSKRVLLKLCMSKSPGEVALKLMQLHPYLNPSSILQQIYQKQQKNE